MHAHVCLCVHVRSCVDACVFVCVHVHLCVRSCAHTCVFMHGNVCSCVCACVFTCMCDWLQRSTHSPGKQSKVTPPERTWAFLRTPGSGPARLAVGAGLSAGRTQCPRTPAVALPRPAPSTPEPDASVSPRVQASALTCSRFPSEGAPYKEAGPPWAAGSPRHGEQGLGHTRSSRRRVQGRRGKAVKQAA